MIDIDNGSGLQYAIIPDRCMDIGKLSYKEVNFCHITKAGFVRPEYYDRTESNWLNTFGGGFLATCGLRNVGTPCEFDDLDKLTLPRRIVQVESEVM